MSRSLHTCVCRASRITRTGRVLDDVWSKKAKSAGYVARSAYKLLEIQEKYKLIPPGGRVLDLGCHPGAWLQVACGALGPPGRGGLVLGVDIQVGPPARPPALDRLPPAAPPPAQQASCPPLHAAGDQGAREVLRRASAHRPGRRARAAQALLGRSVPTGAGSLARRAGAAAPEPLPDLRSAAATRRLQGFDAVLSDMCHFTHGNATLDAYKSLELAHTAYDVATGAGAEEADAVLRPGGSLVMKLLQGEGTQEFALEMKGAFQKVVWHRSKATRSESKEIFLLGLKRR